MSQNPTINNKYTLITMKVETAQDAGVQELQSVGAFTGILLVISETLRNYGIESPIAVPHIQINKYRWICISITQLNLQYR